MTFAEYAAKSNAALRVLVEITSYDSSWNGYYSTSDFTPSGSTQFYEGRLVAAPKISIKRDSSFFGILVYSSSGFSLHNADAGLDDFGQGTVISGGKYQVLIGFDGLDYSSYQTIFTGYVDKFTVTETQVDVRVSDLRKRLKRANTVSRALTNAVTFIQDILTSGLSITYDATNFDTTAWETARSAALNVSRYYPDNDTIDAAISDISVSTLGFFSITGTGLYTYKIIDTSATSVTTIMKFDIMNRHSISYETDYILSSVITRSPQWSAFSAGTDLPDISAVTILAFAGSGKTIFAGSYGTKGQIFKSSDAGQTWTLNRTITASSNILSMVQVTGDIYICGTDGPNTVYRTIDGGDTWTGSGTLGSASEGRALCYVGSGVALCGTNNFERLFKSTDYGSSWALAATFSSTTLYGLAVVSGPTVILTGDGAIYRSTDYGSSWSAPMTLGTSTSLFGLANIGNDVLLVTDSTDNVTYRSTDLGSSWTNIGTIGIGVRCHTGNDYGEAWAGTVSPKDQLYYSTDYGSTFSTFESLPGDRSGGALVGSVFWVDRGNLVVCDSLTGGGKIYVKSFGADADATYVTYASARTSTISAYGIDTEKTFETLFSDSADATTFAGYLQSYFGGPQRELSVTTPVKYYSVVVGDMVDVEVWRTQTSMLGTVKCEVIGINWNLDQGTMTFNLRIP